MYILYDIYIYNQHQPLLLYNIPQSDSTHAVHVTASMSPYHIIHTYILYNIYKYKQQGPSPSPYDTCRARDRKLLVGLFY